MKKIKILYDRLFRFWMTFPEKIRFLLVGGYNTVVSYALYSLFLYFSGGNSPQLSLFLAFVVSSLNSYWTQRIYVFQSKNTDRLKEYFKCLTAWGINYGCNAVLLLILTRFLNPYLAQLVALILVTINSYLMLKYIAFKPKSKESL